MSKKFRTSDIGNCGTIAAAELMETVPQQLVRDARRFCFELTRNSSIEVRVICGGWERVRSGQAIEIKKFPRYAIEFVAAGTGWVVFDDKEHALIPGSVFGYMPGSSLKISVNSGEFLEKYYIVFAGQGARKIFRWADLVSRGVRQTSAIHQIRELFELMIANGLAQTRYSPTLCASLLPALAYKIAEQPALADRNDVRAFATYQEIQKLIDRDFLKFKSVEQVAAYNQLSVTYICRLFKRFNYVTPYNYLLRRRMQFAAGLLSDPQFLIKQAARQLGFADQFQFSRAFKRCIGISPVKFQRKLHRYSKE
ncbi:MAG TPA: AraC family transcriptional regulator [Pirellulales bacterium]|nr:AraC family transcriptional regulator [Pirellulales bacterium]